MESPAPTENIMLFRFLRWLRCSVSRSGVSVPSRAWRHARDRLAPREVDRRHLSVLELECRRLSALVVAGQHAGIDQDDLAAEARADPSGQLRRVPEDDAAG